MCLTLALKANSKAGRLPRPVEGEKGGGKADRSLCGARRKKLK
jgi:hypothetical protein